MKKILLLILSVFTINIGSSFAQTIDDEITMVQEAFGKDKKMIVEALMELPETMAPAFWTVYEEYETARQELGRERIKIINDYLETYSQLGEAEADALANRSLKNDAALAKLHSTYYKKFKKATSALNATKFLQIDTYIHNTIRNAMQQQLPFIGEF
ncbi:MAG: hypothetical protein PSV36_07910 [Algoriphagus sp.]|nr:hypothetical protein [Algoriphagus sp.]